VRDPETGNLVRLGEDGFPLGPGDDDVPGFYRFNLWRSALVNGEARLSGLQALRIPDEGITRYLPPGGALTRYLFPVVVQNAKERKIPLPNPQEAWGWLPPVLANEGQKVQTDWLHDFLLDPYRIRPAAVMRMPKFNLSYDDATALSNYFAARDNAEYPYEYEPRSSDSFLAETMKSRPEHLEQAMDIVVNNNYCVKCHIVGDYPGPKGSQQTALAPDLAKVHGRFRPTYLRDWIANPKRILPYTGMPQNIPPENRPDILMQLYPDATPTEQVMALVDLLLNFDEFTRQQTSIASMVKPAPPADQNASSAPPASE